MSNIDAFDDGRAAYLSSDEIYNPHEPGTPLYHFWLKGFESAEDENERRSRASKIYAMPLLVKHDIWPAIKKVVTWPYRHVRYRHIRNSLKRRAEAHAEGRKAFVDGLDIEDNPYNRETHPNSSHGWWGGWQSEMQRRSWEAFRLDLAVFHSLDQDGLHDLHPMANESQYCTRCGDMVHAFNNECMRSWFEYDDGTIVCVDCSVDMGGI